MLTYFLGLPYCCPSRLESWLLQFRPSQSVFGLSTATIMSTDALQSYQTELLIQAQEVGALKFGQFTLKSGRYASMIALP